MPEAKPRHGGPLSTVAVTVTLFIIGILAAGCLRAHATLVVSADGQVSGDLIAAALPTAGDHVGPHPVLPSALNGRVTVLTYQADGYVGTELSFHNLDFTEFSTLLHAADGDRHDYQLTLQRSGDLIILSGSVDLTPLPAAGADVQISVTFPGDVIATNGSAHGHTITWSPRPGRVSTMTATTQYVVGAARSWSWTFWAVLVAALGLVAAVAVGGLALVARRRDLRETAQP